MRPTLRTCALLLAVALSGCKSSGYLNERYPFESRPDPFTLAVVPAIRGPLAVHTDTVAAEVFTDPRYTLVPPAEIRERMDADPDLRRRLMALALHDYTRAELGAESQASAALAPDELAALRRELGARYVLLPKEFSVGSSLGVLTAGVATYRLYDLDTGALIYERSRPLNVNVPGEPGAILLSSVLISQTGTTFKELFLNK